MIQDKPRASSRLQQQPTRAMDRQQQQSSGSREFQPRRRAEQQGERTSQQLGSDRSDPGQSRGDTASAQQSTGWPD